MRVLSLAQVAVLVATTLMYAFSTACYPDPQKGCHHMVLLTEKDNGATIDIRAGESITINLPENATTGYRWAIDHYDQKCLEATATEPHYAANAVGSGGQVAFTFVGRKKGSGEIVLKHWRHWEGDLSITGSFRLRLNVLP